MKKYVRKIPEVINAKQITEEDFDGFEVVCAHCIGNLITLDERFIEEEYKDSEYRCDAEDDGYCLQKEDCKCKRKIGYIQIPRSYQYKYPMVSDYLIKDEDGNIKIMRKEKFEKLYELKEE